MKPPPLPLYNQYTITKCWMCDHKTMVRKNHQNNGHTGSSCLDKPMLGQGGGGYGTRDNLSDSRFTAVP